MGGPQGVLPGPPNQQAPPQQTPLQGTSHVPQGGPQQPGGPPGATGALTQQASRLSQLEAERQQNLLKIHQLQLTLEAAQQKELQYKQAALEHIQQQQQQQQQQQHLQLMLERQRLQMQQQQQQQLQQQQHLQQQQMQHHQQLCAGGTNPQLRHLLQQQALQLRQPSQQLMFATQQQQQQGVPSAQGPGMAIRGQMVGGGLSGLPPQQPQGQPPWDDPGLQDVLDFM